MDYDAWNGALADWFFRADTGHRPTYLQVDDDELDEIGQHHGVDGGQWDFLSAVVLEIASTGPAFVGVRNRARVWRNGSREDAPPFITLLAACVLAASRMASDATRQIAAHNYYARLGDVLGRDVDLSEDDKGYLADCWRALNEWLVVDLRGSRGAPTAHARGHFSRIGFALSQCVLRAEDRSRLPDFYEWGVFSPRSSVEPEDIKEDFFEWVSLSRCTLTASARERLRRSPADVRDLVAEVVARELLDWDGTHRTTGGQRFNPILLQGVETVPRRRLDIQLVARRPEDFPVGEFSYDGSVVELSAGGHGVYDSLPISVTTPILRTGLSLVRGSFVMRLRSQALYVLAPDYELGDWVSREQTAIGQTHVIIAAPEYSSNVELILLRHASSGFFRYASVSGMPEGWCAFGDVRFEHAFDAPEPLSALEPRRSVEVLLAGGLKFSGTAWMRLGPPTVRASWDGPAKLEVELDGSVLGDYASPVVVDLAAHGLGDGQHSVRVGARVRTFELHSRTPAPGARRVGLAGWPLIDSGVSLGTQCVPAEGIRQSLCGALLLLQEGDERPPIQLIGRADVDSIVLIGAKAGDYYDVPIRRLSAQLKTDSVRMARPGFKVAWLVERKQGVGRLYAIQHPPPEPDIYSLSSCASQQIESWCGHLRGALHVPRDCDDSCRGTCARMHEEYLAAGRIAQEYLLH